MTTEEIDAKITNLLARKSTLELRIVQRARPLIALLKDAGHPASAEELSVLYFEHDVLDQEMIDFLKANPSALPRMLRGKG